MISARQTIAFGKTLLKFSLGETTTQFSPISLGLLTAHINPVDDSYSGQLEVNNLDYSRIPVFFSYITESATLDSGDVVNINTAKNSIDIVFGPTQADWGKIYGIGIFGDINNDLRYYANFTTPRLLPTNNTLTILQNTIIINLN